MGALWKCVTRALLSGRSAAAVPGSGQRNRRLAGLLLLLFSEEPLHFFFYKLFYFKLFVKC